MRGMSHVVARLRGVAAALACAWVLSACHKGGTEVCEKGCEKTVSCLGGTTQQIAQCKANNNCAAKDNNPDNCTPDSYNASNDCAWECIETKSCTEVLGCLAGCPKCVRAN